MKDIVLSVVSSAVLIGSAELLLPDSHASSMARRVLVAVRTAMILAPVIKLLKN